MSSGQLSLKVEIFAKKTSRTLMFAPNMTVADTLSIIKEKTGEGGLDHGLFFYENSNKGRWMRGDKKLGEYDLKNGDTVIYKKKTGQLKVKIADAGAKTILVDMSLPVEELVAAIGQKLNIEGSEEFSLKKEGSAEWLSPKQNLLEQGVDTDTDTVVLRQKLFLSDTAVNKDDAVQLHLYYSEARDQVLSGNHLINENEAIQFASLQAQIVYGNHTPEIEKNFKCKDFVPPNFSGKVKKLESSIVKEWKKYLGLTESVAKFRYLQLFKSVKSYGTTTFIVKEKRTVGIGGKKVKTLPVRISISKDAIIRMDPDTKEELKRWPITHLRRWNATSNQFTFDFGDYETEYYVVQTIEGESISQILDGYIKAILKKRQRAAAPTTEVTGTVANEVIIPAQMGVAMATFSPGFGGGFVPQVQQYYYQMMNNGFMPLQFSEQMPSGPMGQAQGTSVDAGQMFMMTTDLDSASAAVMNMLNDYSTPLTTAQLTLGDFQPQAIVQDMSFLSNSMHSSVFEMLNGLQTIEMTDINNQASKISYNVAAMMQRAKLLGGGADDGHNALISGAKNMSEAIGQLLQCSALARANPSDQAALDRLNQATHNFEIASCFMNAACSGALVDESTSQLYIENARAVACSLDDLLFECQNVDLIPASHKMQIDFVGKSLMSTATLLSRAMTEPACQAQLQQATQAAYQTALGFVNQARTAGVDASILQRLTAAATKVGDGINLLVNTARCADSAVIDSITDIRSELDQMKNSVTLLSNAAGNGLQMQSYVTSTIDVTNRLLAAARTAVTVTQNPETAQRIAAQVDVLQKQSALFATLSKTSIDNPKDASAFAKLLEAAKGLVNASQQMLTSASVQINHYDTLRTACKSSSAVITSLVTSSKAAVRTVNNQEVRQAILTEALQTEGAVSRVISALIQSTADPKNAQLNSNLFAAARELSRPAAKLIETSSKLLPLVSDEQQQATLKSSSTNAQKILQELISACKGVSDASGGSAIDEALQKIQISIAEVDSSIVEVDSGSPLPAIPNATRDGSLTLIENAVRNLAGGIKRITETTVKGGAELAAAISATAGGVGEIVLSAKQLSACVTPDLKSQSAILRVAKQAVTDTVAVIEASRALSTNPSEANSTQLKAACGAIGQSINKIIPTCRSAGSGNQECDQAAAIIIREAEKLTPTAIVTQDKTFPQCAVLIGSMTKGLTAAVSQLSVISKQATRDNLPAIVNSIASNMPHLIAASSAAATLSPTTAGRTDIIDAARKVAQALAKVIATAKVANSPDGAKAFDAEVAAYNNTINGLVASLDSATPGQQELNDSLQLITAAMSSVSFTPTGTAVVGSVGRNPQRAVSGGGADNVKDLLAAAKSLADSIGKIVATSRTTPEKAGPLMKQAAESISVIFSSFDAAKAENSQIATSAKNVAEATSKMAEVLKQVLSNPKEANNQRMLASVAQTTGDAIKQLMAATKMSAVGQKECEDSMEKVQASVEDLGSASINVTVGLLDLLVDEPTTKSAQQLQVEIASAAKSIANIITQVPTLSPQQFAPLVVKLGELVPALATSTKYLVTKTTDSESQQDHIAKSKEVADQVFTVIQALKQVSAEPEDQVHRKLVAEAGQKAQAAISTLVSAHSSSLGMIKECEDSIDAVTAAATILNKPLTASGKSYQQSQDDLSNCSKALASSISNLVRVSRTDAEKIGGASKEVASVVPKILEATRIAASSITNESIRKNLMAAAGDVVSAVQRLLEGAKIVVIDPKNTKNQNAVSAGFKDVTDSITKLINSLKEGATGYKQCDTAIEQVVAIIAELDAAALFAASGQMDVQIPPGVTLEDTRNSVNKSSDALTAAAKQLIAAVQSTSQEELGKTALQISAAITTLAKDSKTSAALLSDVTSQQEILNGAKTILEVTQQLILSGKESQAHPADTTAKELFQRSTQLVNGTVQQLKETFEKAASDAIASIQELEKSKQEIKQSTADALVGKGAVTQGATAEDVVKSLRAVAGTAAALVAAGNTAETIDAAKEASKFTAQLLANIRGTPALGDPKVTAELLQTSKATSEAMCNLLELLKTQRRDDVDNQKKISAASAAVADSVNGVLNAARKLPGGKNLELEDNDLEKIAEKELLAAAEAIEKAAKKLAPKREKKEGQVLLREEELADDILESAREVTAVTKELIIAATAVQKEIKAKGRESTTISPYKKDPAWAQGLISAAKAVAGTTGDLVHASNEAIKKAVGEEVVIAATKIVAGATARLVAASRAKADLNSPTQQTLTRVAKNVAEATARLAAAARANAAPVVAETDDTSSLDDANEAKLRIAELEQQAKIAALELQLERARGQLATNRKNEYSGAKAPPPSVSSSSPAPSPGTRPLPKVASGGVAQRLWGKK